MAHAHRTARGWLILLTVLLLAFVAAVIWVVVARAQGNDGGNAAAVSQEGEAADPGDGWFTEDQASRGEEAYGRACASCHGPQLEGGSGPALTGDAFWDRWEGDTVHTLFEVTSQTMPQDDPGSLDLETYADITAHVLHVNRFPAGDDELPPDQDRLTALTIEESQTADEGDAAQGVSEEDTEGETSEGEPTQDASEEVGDGEPARADGARAAPPTEGDGWFAEAQVRAGEATYAEHCARCHGNDLQGDPPLAGGGFPERYGTVWALYQYVRQTMPFDDPGSLRAQAYLDAVAYLLDENGYPMGEQRREPMRAVLIEMELDTERADRASTEGEQPEDDEAADADEGSADGRDEGDDQADDASGSQDSGSEGGAAAERTSGDDASGEGHYDQEQADRGQEPYAQHCAQCHGDDLQGQPPLAGESFLSNFESVWDLFEYTRENMPQGDPGSLDDETYGDIVAYVLSENDLPDGGEELGPDQEDAMRDLPLDPDAGDDGERAERADGADGQDDGAVGSGEADEENGADRGQVAAEGDEDEREEAVPGDRDRLALASLEIDARPANLTVNILGPDGLVRRATGAQTLRDLQPGRYVVAGSRGHESTTVNVDVAAGRTTRVRLVLDELSRSTDVPEEPAVPTTEIPAIPRDPGEGVLIGEARTATTGSARATGAVGSTTPNSDTAIGRGQQAFALHCARCHGDDLQGNVAPALGGDVFFERWGGHPVDWFYFQARAAMPPHGAASLREQTYADIVVYLLTANGVLEGYESYAPGDEAFRTLVIEPRHATDGGRALEAQVDRLRETLFGPQHDGEPTVVGPVAPVEWPADPGVAPIGKDGDRAVPLREGPPGEEPDAAPETEDEGRVDGGDRLGAERRPVANPSRAA